MTLIYAHRGASKYAPENTLSSFKHALVLEADGIETDVQLTKDHAVIVMHDATVDRTTPAHGKIKDYTLKTLLALSNGEWFDQAFHEDKILSLPQLLDWWETTNLFLNIELKSHRYNDRGLVSETLRQLKHVKKTEKLTLSSFNPAYLKQVKTLNPALTTGYLTKKQLSERLLKKHCGYIDGVHLHYKAFTTDYLKRVHSLGLYLHLYTVNDAVLFDDYLRAGVDGIITDDPALRTSPDV
ncbi:glycerophosphoryl diester phosphodiesterase [Halolactibacillus miurensis]|uniref:Glycerophosphoryl diester phosphodiesterase n=1 Tax=Halolactibacillus miurensis TaxID=306541 RepID=A0A1I6PUD4_9BACI|nr:MULTISPECIES: glycerophosphodiester phosphodiesterase family protein [Halolactibacillus]GEM04454.1 glycerophosphoryl diester phosphodiesterase [Halolactibacillus miurensis]SFS43823.1 glycerophosphoryl diester phosphodiesterase [Halolactibacillus miurensis]